MLRFAGMPSDSSALIALILGIAIAALILGYYCGVLSTKWRARGDVRIARKDAVNRSRAVLTGNFSEQLAPYLPNFPYSPSEVRFVGKPIDYIVFEGLDQHKVKRVVFLEVKSGGAVLSGTERSLRDAIEAGNVEFAVYQAPSYGGNAATAGQR
jgi:predicted Holliday junction resolvase-like endonuclease